MMCRGVVDSSGLGIEMLFGVEDDMSFGEKLPR
jgi:hypothetical protein